MFCKNFIKEMLFNSLHNNDLTFSLKKNTSKQYMSLIKDLIDLKIYLHKHQYKQIFMGNVDISLEKSPLIKRIIRKVNNCINHGCFDAFKKDDTTCDKCHLQNFIVSTSCNNHTTAKVCLNVTCAKMISFRPDQCEECSKLTHIQSELNRLEQERQQLKKERQQFEQDKQQLFKKNKKRKKENKECCTICLREFKPEDQNLYNFECLHKMHDKPCFSDYIKHSFKCPVCPAKALIENTHVLFKF
jgi:hypothetical protein